MKGVNDPVELIEKVMNVKLLGYQKALIKFDVFKNKYIVFPPNKYWSRNVGPR